MFPRVVCDVARRDGGGARCVVGHPDLYFDICAEDGTAAVFLDALEGAEIFKQERIMN